MKIAYGWTVTGDDDELLKIIAEGIEIFTATSQPGRWLVETIPWLRFVPSWFPGAEFKRKAAHNRERMRRIDVIPFKWTKEQIVSQCFLSMVPHVE